VTELFVRVNSKCCGYTLCVDLCPEVFSLDDSGFAVVRDEAVPSELYEKVEEAASSCPEEAIELRQV
jgi:ferredoxin